MGIGLCRSSYAGSSVNSGYLGLYIVPAFERGELEMGMRIASLRTKEAPCTFAYHRCFGRVSAGEEVGSFSPVVVD